MDRPRFTTVQHGPRLKLGLSLSEYCIADSIYHLSNNPKHPICTQSTTGLGEFIGMSKRSVITIIKTLVKSGLVEKKSRENEQHLGWITTEKWYREVVVESHHGSQRGEEAAAPSILPSDKGDSRAGEETAPVKKLHPTGEEVAPDTVKKVHQGGEETAHNNNNNTDTLETREQQQEMLLLLGDFEFNEKTMSVQQIVETYEPERICEVVKQLRQKSEKEAIPNPEGWIVAALKNAYEFNGAKKVEKRKRTQRATKKKRETERAAAEEQQQQEREQRIQTWIGENPTDFERVLEAVNVPESIKGIGDSAIERHRKITARVQVGRILDGEKGIPTIPSPPPHETRFSNRSIGATTEDAQMQLV